MDDDDGLLAGDILNDDEDVDEEQLLASDDEDGQESQGNITSTLIEQLNAESEEDLNDDDAEYEIELGEADDGSLDDSQALDEENVAQADEQLEPEPEASNYVEETEQNQEEAEMPQEVDAESAMEESAVSNMEPQEEQEEEEEEESDSDDEEGAKHRDRFRSERAETGTIATSLSTKHRTEIPDTLELKEDDKKKIEEFMQQSDKRRRDFPRRGGHGNLGRGSNNFRQGNQFPNQRHNNWQQQQQQHQRQQPHSLLPPPNRMPGFGQFAGQMGRGPNMEWQPPFQDVRQQPPHLMARFPDNFQPQPQLRPQAGLQIQPQGNQKQNPVMRTPGSGTILVNPHFRGPMNIQRPQPPLEQQPLMRDNMPFQGNNQGMMNRDNLNNSQILQQQQQFQPSFAQVPGPTQISFEQPTSQTPVFGAPHFNQSQAPTSMTGGSPQFGNAQFQQPMMNNRQGMSRAGVTPLMNMHNNQGMGGPSGPMQQQQRNMQGAMARNMHRDSLGMGNMQGNNMHQNFNQGPNDINQGPPQHNRQFQGNRPQFDQHTQGSNLRPNMPGAGIQNRPNYAPSSSSNWPRSQNAPQQNFNNGSPQMSGPPNRGSFHGGNQQQPQHNQNFNNHNMSQGQPNFRNQGPHNRGQPIQNLCNSPQRLQGRFTNLPPLRQPQNQNLMLGNKTSPVGSKREADSAPTDVVPTKQARKVLTSGRVLGMKTNQGSTDSSQAQKPPEKKTLRQIVQQQNALTHVTPPRPNAGSSLTSSPLSTSTPKSEGQTSQTTEEAGSLGVDSDYQRMIEEQKRKREAIKREKEERRLKQAAARKTALVQKLQQTGKTLEEVTSTSLDTQASGQATPTQNKIKVSKKQLQELRQQGATFRIVTGPGGMEQAQGVGRGAMSNRGHMAPNRGQMMPNRGQFNQNRGQMATNRGQMVPNRGQMIPNRGQMTPNRGQMTPNRGQMTSNRGLVSNRGQMLNRGQLTSNRGQGRGVSGNQIVVQNPTRGGPAGLRGGMRIRGTGRGHHNPNLTPVQTVDLGMDNSHGQFMGDDIKQNPNRNILTQAGHNITGDTRTVVPSNKKILKKMVVSADPNVVSIQNLSASSTRDSVFNFVSQFGHIQNLQYIQPERRAVIQFRNSLSASNLANKRRVMIDMTYAEVSLV